MISWIAFQAIYALTRHGTNTSIFLKPFGPEFAKPRRNGLRAEYNPFGKRVNNDNQVAYARSGFGNLVCRVRSVSNHTATRKNAEDHHLPKLGLAVSRGR